MCSKIIAIIAMTLLPTIMSFYLKKFYKRQLAKYCKSNEETESKMIFTTFNNHKCKMHLYKRSPCSEMCSYIYLLEVVKFIETANESISLCMYLSTCREIHEALVRAHNRGLQIRFLTDAGMLASTASRTLILREAGIPIKVPKRGILNHQFCLADENTTESKLFFGTLNLTAQAFTSNWDLITFTNSKKMIERFQDEFEYLWDSLDYAL